MSDMQAALSRLVDEAAIRDSTARFADTATRGDYDGFRKLWAEAGSWKIGKPFEADCDGVEEILALLHKLRDPKEFFVQFAVQGPIVINGDEATSSCVCHESGRGPGKTYFRNHGLFFDRLRRSGDEWVFTHRRYEYLWLDTTAFSGDAFAPPPLGPSL